MENAKRRWHRYARLFGPDPAADVDTELKFHLEAKVDDLIAQGFSPQDARKEAERQFGDLRSVQAMGEELGQELQRKKDRADLSGDLLQDLRYAMRTLRKDRAFTIVTVLILALGIAANTAVFSVVNAVLFRPLPFSDPEQLTWITADRTIKEEVRAIAGLSAVTYTVDAYEEYKRHNKSFQGITSYNPFLGNGDFTMTGRGEPVPVAALMVARDFFQTLGVRPALGRYFLAEECHKGGKPAALLGYYFWQNQFSGDPAIVGQSIVMNKQSFTVVGVLPASFDFGSVFSPGTKMDVYIPAVMDEMRNWGNTLAIVGRLKPGVSVASAQAEANVLFPQLKAAHKEWWGTYDSTITGLQEFVSGKLRRSLYSLWAAVGLTLLIVCVNLSNLQIARAASRTKEFAVRLALGAGRGRLIRQLLAESLVLATGGALLGLAIAYGLTFYISHQNSIALPLLSSVTLDSTTLLWTLAIAVTTALVFGLVPGLRLSSNANVQEALKSSSTGMTTGRSHERVRAAMVISEVALACILLIGAGLLLRSFIKVMDVDLGFRPARAGTIKIDYEDGGDNKRRGVALQEILRNVTAIPGIETAGVTDMLPLGRNRAWGFRAKGRQYGKDDIQAALVRIVTPGYLGAMGMKLRAGRDFTWQDGDSKQAVAVINEAAAKYHFPGRDPVGQLGQINGRDALIIGVLADVRAHSPEAEVGPEMYLHTMQAGPEGAELVVRTSLPSEAVGATLMKVLRSLNPGQPAAEFRPLQQIVDQSVSPRRFFVYLVSSFAILGLILASLGIYGVMSYSVTRQTQEIGIRMALGASGGQVQAGVMRNALVLATAGAAIGGVGSFIAARWIASLLYGTTPNDSITFAGVILVLGAVALLAGYIPARRASRIEPMIALRTT
jgi:predicted permease